MRLLLSFGPCLDSCSSSVIRTVHSIAQVSRTITPTEIKALYVWVKPRWRKLTFNDHKCCKQFYQILQDIGSNVHPSQLGSLRGSSATICLLSMFRTWLSCLDKQRNSFRIILLDFSQAFDRINLNIF